MISATERQERLEAVESVIGTQRAEGLDLSPGTRALLNKFVDGEMSLDQVSAALDQHAKQAIALPNVA